jgi:hypothetical protein
MGISPPELSAETVCRSKCERNPTVIRDGIRQFLPDAQSGSIFRAKRVVPRRVLINYPSPLNEAKGFLLFKDENWKGVI